MKLILELNNRESSLPTVPTDSSKRSYVIENAWHVGCYGNLRTLKLATNLLRAAPVVRLEGNVDLEMLRDSPNYLTRLLDCLFH